ncbi:MAG: sulfite exporter TauE/SafE family protein [Reichenbachiella sp.]
MLWNALFLGFIGSTHCILMCGPIVLSIPGQKTFSRFFFSRITYNIGRVFTYSILGLIVGYIGQTLSFSNFQQPFSILIGSFICLMSFIFIAQRIEGKLSILAMKLTLPFKKWISDYFERTSIMASFSSGLLNGILPCGLVYVALGSALGTFSMQNGGLFMLIFGLGTFPAMLTMSMLGKVSIGRYFKNISPIYVFFLGLLLILRGSNLDIPYLSPLLAYIYPSMGDPVICN